MSVSKPQPPRGTVTVIPPAPKAKAVPGDGTPGPGRPKGSADKVGRSIREMVEEALKRSGESLGGDGGVTYFEYLAITEPKAFAMLVGKCIPLQVGVDVTQHAPVQRVERTIVRPEPKPDNAPGLVVPLKRA